MRIGIISVPIWIWIWFGSNMEIRIRIGINAMPIHNTGFLKIQKIDDWMPRLGLQNVTHDIDYRLSAIIFTGPALKQLQLHIKKHCKIVRKQKKDEAFLRYAKKFVNKMQFNELSDH